MTHIPDGFLTADRVRMTYATCFRNEHSNSAKNTTVHAVFLRHTFSIRAIQSHREDIIKMLLALPAGFRSDERGGGSIADIGRRDDLTIWTDDASDAEKLVALGLATGLLSFCAPREKWSILPGGMPYVRVEITRFGVSVN